MIDFKTLKAKDLKLRDHAKTQGVKRFGVDFSQLPNFCYQALQHSYEVPSNRMGYRAFQHLTKDIFIVIEEVTLEVVTIIDKVSNDYGEFLDDMPRVLDIQRRKIDKKFRLELRELQIEAANLTHQIAGAMYTKASANLPNVKAEADRRGAALEQKLLENAFAQKNLERQHAKAHRKINLVEKELDG